MLQVGVLLRVLWIGRKRSTGAGIGSGDGHGHGHLWVLSIG